MASYDPHSKKLRWRTKIGSTNPPFPPGVEQVTNNLVTLAEDTVYYNSNLGVIAAVSASDGSIRWLTRYDRANEQTPSRRAAYLSRDLTPCVYDQGIVVTAPSDSPFIYALDAATGALLWRCESADDVVHLLGVASGNLIATGDRLWWINMQTGKPVEKPWPETLQSGVRGYGRGAIAGSYVYWPTRDGKLLVFDVVPQRGQDGLVAPVANINLKSYGAEGGNVVIAGRHVIIAGAREIYALTASAATSQVPAREGVLSTQHSVRGTQ